MSRPLLITDCDEVLLHMVSHFGAYVDEVHGLEFALENGDFVNSLKRRDTGAVVGREEVWPLLDGFFATEMHRQTLVPHARDALAAAAEIADVVVLTNLGDHCHAGRVAQLEAVGIHHRVVCNQGGKGDPVARLVAEYGPSSTVFVDDLPQHHASVARHAPQVWRLHMIAEPLLAPQIPAAPDAHARIDDWAAAQEWVLEKLRAGPAGETLAA